MFRKKVLNCFLLDPKVIDLWNGCVQKFLMSLCSSHLKTFAKASYIYVVLKPLYSLGDYKICNVVHPPNNKELDFNASVLKTLRRVFFWRTMHDMTCINQQELPFRSHFSLDDFRQNCFQRCYFRRSSSAFFYSGRLFKVHFCTPESGCSAVCVQSLAFSEMDVI